MPIFYPPEYLQRAVAGPEPPNIGGAFDVLAKLAAERQGQGQEAFATMLQSLPADTREAILPRLLGDPNISSLFDPTKREFFPKKGAPAPGTNVATSFKGALEQRNAEVASMGPMMTPEQRRLALEFIGKRSAAAGIKLDRSKTNAWVNAMASGNLPEDPEFYNMIGATDPSDASLTQQILAELRKTKKDATILDAVTAYENAKASGEIGILRKRIMLGDIKEAAQTLTIREEQARGAVLGGTPSPADVANAEKEISMFTPVIAAVRKALEFAEGGKAGTPEGKKALLEASTALVLAKKVGAAQAAMDLAAGRDVENSVGVLRAIVYAMSATVGHSEALLKYGRKPAPGAASPVPAEPSKEDAAVKRLEGAIQKMLDGEELTPEDFAAEE